MNLLNSYAKKRISPTEAAWLVQSGHWIDLGWCNGFPHAFDKALSERIHTLEDINLRGAVLLSVPHVFERDVTDHFTWNSWHLSGIERKLAAKGNVYYSPLRYSELPRYYRESPNPPDLAVLVCAPMDEEGYFSFGCNPSHLRAICDVAKTIIIEVNPHMPYTMGNGLTKIHLSEVDYIIESNTPLPTIHTNPPTEADEAIAHYVTEQIPQGACLQLGIGSLPNRVGDLIATTDLRDLSVHSEMYVDAFVNLTKLGKMSGKYKALDNHKQVFAFALGNEAMYAFLDHNDMILPASVDYVNNPHIIGQIDNFISINNCLEIDVSGQVDAESIGSKQISGAGGQLDFVEGAYLSRGGKSFICCSSTYIDKEGNLQSRIKSSLASGSIMTCTRTAPHYIVTEYGAVNLKGLTCWQRAEAIISLAHPSFREDLIHEAEALHVWRKSNKKPA